MNEKQKKLLEALTLCNQIKKYDQPNESQADTLSHSLLDIEESFNKVFSTLIPKISKSSNSDEIYDALLDIGEEFRHIIYHIKDPDFFNYLFEKSKLKDN
ncbi:MAG: hypothetical protein HRT87_01585 [Legionellales bacterium]|nr:hypothetical protein [Legionellales bacterium]